MKMFIFFWSREVLHWMEGVLGFKVIQEGADSGDGVSMARRI